MEIIYIYLSSNALFRMHYLVVQMSTQWMRGERRKMKKQKKTKFLLFVIPICIVLMILCGLLIKTMISKAHNTEIKCMSFNVLGFENEGYLPVAQRAKYMETYLNESRMDLIGLQEAGNRDYNWQEDFTQRIVGEGIYKAVTIGTEKTYKEQTAEEVEGRVSNSVGLIILYKEKRFELLESGSQRYSSTENQERHFQWAKLKDKKTDKIVFMTNTHWSIDWDENGKVSREAGDAHRTKQANELREFWEKNVGDHLLFATGDYNCTQNSEWLQLASTEVYKRADAVTGKDSGVHINHIFVNSEHVNILDYQLLKDKIEIKDDLYDYSDQEPLVVTVTYK